MTQGFSRQQEQRVGLVSAGLACAIALAHAWLGTWADMLSAAACGVLSVVVVLLSRRYPGSALAPWLTGAGLSVILLATGVQTGSPLYLGFLGLTALIVGFLAADRPSAAPALMPVATAVPLAAWLALQAPVPTGGPAGEALRAASLVAFLILTGLAFERVRDQALAQAMRGQRRAEKAGLSQSRLLGRVSHALAEPLHGVLDVARELAARRVPEAARRDLEVLQGSAASMLTLVTDLIHLAAARSGDLAGTASSTDLGARVGAEVERWQRVAAARGQRLAWTGPPAPLLVRTDPAALQLVLDRLLGHALAAAGPGPVTVEVLAVAGGGAVVEVSGGAPPSEAEARRAFVPFAEGTDLQLAAAREVALAAGASLAVAEGAALRTLRLQLPAAPPPEASRVASPTPPAGTPDAWRRAFTERLIGTLATVAAASVLAYLALGSPRDGAVASGVLAVTMAVKVLVGRGRWRRATLTGAVGLSAAFATGAVLTGSAAQVAYLGVSAVALLFIGGVERVTFVLRALTVGYVVALVAVVEAPAGPVALVEVARGAFLVPTLFLLSRSYETARKRALQAALEAQAAAEAAAEAQSRFLQGASHQLRTPLNGILGMAQTLWGEVPTAAERRSVETLTRSATAMHSRVNELIDAARAGTGEVLLAPAPVEVAVMLEDVVALHGPAAGRRGLTLSAALPPVGLWALADESRLRQVLGALLANAVAFTGQGRVAVEASLAAAGEGRALLTVDVADTGPGVPPAVAAALAASGRLEPSPGGVGLDLAISRELALAMGGTLGLVASGPGGSTFRLQVPLPRAAAPALPSPLPSPWPARVMVVDDNPVNLTVAARLLSRLGAQAVVVPSGEAALASAGLGHFDLVLMDLQMPGLDGFETTRRLKAQGLEVPVVALTASAQPETPGLCRAAGMAGCLVKPVKLDQLAGLLDGLLERRAA